MAYSISQFSFSFLQLLLRPVYLCKQVWGRVGMREIAEGEKFTRRKKRAQANFPPPSPPLFSFPSSLSLRLSVSPSLADPEKCKLQQRVQAAAAKKEKWLSECLFFPTHSSFFLRCRMNSTNYSFQGGPYNCQKLVQFSLTDTLILLISLLFQD